jgi:hypothetical protein
MKEGDAKEGYAKEGYAKEGDANEGNEDVLMDEPGTHTYKNAVWPGGAAYGLGNSNGGRFTTFGGGLPIKDAEGRVVGGIGASTVSDAFSF